MRPYRILVLSNDSGLIEPILNTISLHQVNTYFDLWSNSYLNFELPGTYTKCSFFKYILCFRLKSMEDIKSNSVVIVQPIIRQMLTKNPFRMRLRIAILPHLLFWSTSSKNLVQKHLKNSWRLNKTLFKAAQRKCIKRNLWEFKILEQNYQKLMVKMWNL